MWCVIYQTKHSGEWVLFGVYTSGEGTRQAIQACWRNPEVIEVVPCQMCDI